MLEAVSPSDISIEGCVSVDPFGGLYGDNVAVYPAGRFAEMARNPAVIWAVARGAHGEDQFTAHVALLPNVGPEC